MATARFGLSSVAGDTDFRSGEDTVDYKIELPAAVAGPLKVEATLLYQTLGARYAAELFQFKTTEIRALRQYLKRSKHPPQVICPVSKRSDGP